MEKRGCRRPAYAVAIHCRHQRRYPMTSTRLPLSGYIGGKGSAAGISAHYPRGVTFTTLSFFRAPPSANTPLAVDDQRPVSRINSYVNLGGSRESHFFGVRFGSAVDET